jgi:hypothetical protein
MQPELAFDGWIAASEWAPARLMRSVRRQRHVRNRGGIRSFMLDYLVRVRGDHGERQHIDRAKADLFVLRPQMSWKALDTATVAARESGHPATVPSIPARLQ